MKWALLALAMLPAPAMAEGLLLQPVIPVEFKIAENIDARCRTLVMTPAAKAEVEAMKARYGAEVNRLVAQRDMKTVQALSDKVREAMVADTPVIKAFETKYGVQLGREPSSLCKAGEAEIKSGTVIGRMLKRK